jgi:hypothetical protein
MSTTPQIPLPKNPLHQRYADNILSGLSGVESYQRAYAAITPKLTRESAYNGDKRLKKNPEVIAYLRAIRAASATSTVLSVTEKREFLARVVRTDITTLSIDGDGKNGDMIKSYSVNESESSRNIRLEKHDPLKAIDLDNRIAGEDPTANLLTELAQALQNLPKPAVSRL